MMMMLRTNLRIKFWKKDYVKQYVIEPHVLKTNTGATIKILRKLWNFLNNK